MKKSLTFKQLRNANLKRVKQFKNKHGILSHTLGVYGWTPEEWFLALAGELGEYANFRKKLIRGDISTSEFYEEAKKELADVQTYLDLLCARLGFDLGEITREKFNIISDRVGSKVKL